MMTERNMDAQEFLKWHEALIQMPEAENPDLYKRLHRLRELHERRAETAGRKAVGVDLTPEECRYCIADGELCFGHGLLALAEEYRKTKL
jgi:hypothetical protein